MNLQKLFLLLSTVALVSTIAAINTYDSYAAEEYQFKAKFGSKGVANGEFIQPIGIAVDKEGNIYVGDFANRLNINSKIY